MYFSFCVDMNNSTLFGKQNDGFSSPTFPLCSLSIRPVVVPNFAFSPKKKKFKQTRLLVRAHSSSASSPVVGFEVDFKPSFDDYLKAMESVKTVREKRSKSRKSDSDEKNDGKEFREVRDDKGNDRGSIRNWVLGEKKVVYGENVKWVKDMSNVAEEDKGNNGEFRSVYGENVRWVRDKSNMAEEDKGIKRGSINNSVRDERKNVYGENMRWVKDKGNISEKDNGSYRVRDEPRKVYERKVWYGKDVRMEKDEGNEGVEDKFNGGSFRNWIRDEPKVNGSKFGVKSTERFDKQGRNMRWEKNQGNSTFVKGKDYGFKVEDERFQGREMTYSRNMKWEENQWGKDSSKEKDHSFMVDKDRIRGTKMVLGNEKLSANNIVVRRRNRSVDEESDGDEEFESERAAFKPMGGIDDVVDKPRINRNEMEERIQKLARCLNGADVNMPEWMFSKMIRSARIRFSDHSILRIIQLLGKLGNWRRVLQLIDWLQSRERFDSHKLRFIYTTALSVLGKARRPVEALNLFQTMQQQISTYPDLVAYHSIAVTLGQAGHMRELFEVIDIMKSPPKKKFRNGVLEKWDPRLEPDIVVYNAVLNACVRRKQWEGAFWVLQQLQEKGQHPSGTTYGLVMEVEKICRVANKPLVVTYTGLMQACLDAGNIEDGAYVFKHMHKFCSPNLVTCNIILKAYIENGKFEEAKSLFYNMLEDGKHVSSKADYKERVILDMYSFNTMLDACVEEKRWDELEVVYKGMLEYGYPFNAKRHLRMILDAGRAGKGELLETTWNHFFRSGRIPPPHPLLKEMVCTKLEQGDCAAALSYISSHHPSNLQVFSRNAWLKFFNENAHRLQKDSLLRLVHEVSIFISKSNDQNPILQNLVLACKEFITTCASQKDCVET